MSSLLYLKYFIFKQVQLGLYGFIAFIYSQKCVDIFLFCQEYILLYSNTNISYDIYHILEYNQNIFKQGSL